MKPPLLNSIRRTTAFKALNLVFDKMRRVGLIPGTPLKPSPPNRRFAYLRSVLFYLCAFFFQLLIFDALTYILYRVAPTSFGDVYGAGGDFSAWCREQSFKTGAPVWSIWVFWSIYLLLVTRWGVGAEYYGLAFLTTGIGLYRPEEWPFAMDHPELSSSLNEFWGVRYHQVCLYQTRVSLESDSVRSGCGYVNCELRHLAERSHPQYTIHHMAAPFRFLPKTLHTISIFFFLAVIHIILYYPIKHELIIRPYIIFYVGNGIACALERHFLRRTGRKVGGLIGRIWTWSVLVLLIMPTADIQFSSGWLGMSRDILVRDRTTSMVEWIVYGLGYGKDPRL